MSEHGRQIVASDRAHSSILLLGIDGCQRGWVACGIGGRWKTPQCIVFATLHEMIAAATKASNAELTRACIDMPLGLSRDPRAFDAQARRELGKCSSRVFTPPCYEVLACKTYAQANALSRELCDRGLSKQTWNIMPKIRELDALVRAQPQLESVMVETHPEVCFARWSKAPIVQSKKTPEGAQARLVCLEEQAWCVGGIEPVVAELKALAASKGRRRTKQRAKHTPLPARDDIIDAFALLVHAVNTIRNKQ